MKLNISIFLFALPAIIAARSGVESKLTVPASRHPEGRSEA